MLQDLDAILHCGDITSYAVWAYLNSHPAFFAVCGNMDCGAWSLELPSYRLLNLQGLCVGLTHGHALDVHSPDLLQHFEQKPDLFCFGHTHSRHWSWGPAGVMLLNPGSFSLPKSGSPGFGLLQVQARDSFQLEWVDLV